MSEVKKYDMDQTGCSIEDPDGGWVRASDYDALRAEVDALRKDAERYRFLKDQGHFRAVSIDMGGNHAWTGMGRSVGRGATVDAAIDAALAAQREGGEV